MPLNEAYKRIKPSIVAFICKYVPVRDPSDPPPTFYPILGTGVIVREDGVIATNAHVVRALNAAWRPPDLPSGENHVAALLLHQTDQGIVEIPLEIAGVAVLSAFQPGKVYYGPPGGPDLAFVHVRARGLPTAEIDVETVPDEGAEVATAGYPMGRDALDAPGWVHQLTPTLQRGIISAVLPFPCPAPHAFALNVMVQGGASGSPVFSCDSGAVLGLVYAGLFDSTPAADGRGLCRVPTNISYVVPSHYLVFCMERLKNVKEMQPSPNAKTLDELMASGTFKNVFDEGRMWVRRQAEPPAADDTVVKVAKLATEEDPAEPEGQ